jgi:hypothetical protein
MTWNTALSDIPADASAALSSFIGSPILEAYEI